MQPYPQPQQPPPAPSPAAAPYAPAQPPALPPGTILLDRYLIQGYIGGGGFGHIYKAFDNALGYRRAIKEAFFHDPMTRHQFHLEAEFLFNTRHPNLVGAYALFEQAGRLYLVMDYVDGHTLEEVAIDHIRRSGWPLPEPRILDWMIPICGALHALHASPVPIIHRDVKPANVKINRHGVPILIDLGLAKLHAQGTKTIGAALAFTPGYAPPEQYRASGATDARTDVYGMGASLFYLLTGYQPTEAPARLGALAVPPLRQLNPHISPLTEAAVIRAMELLPERRQQSALLLEQDLRAARATLGGEPGAAKRWSVAAGVACLACGTACPPGARHCMRCGARLVGGRVTAPQVAQAAQVPRTNPLSAAGEAAPDAEAREKAEAAAPPEQPDPVPGPALGRDSAPAGTAGSVGLVGISGAGELIASGTSAPVVAEAHLTEQEGQSPAMTSAGEPEPEAPRRAVATTPVDQADAPRDDVPGHRGGARELDVASLLPGPTSMPDQPAMVLPPLRRGPAPAAMPLHPVSPAPPVDSTPQSGSHGSGDAAAARRAAPLWHRGSRPRASQSAPVGQAARGPGRRPPPERPGGAATAWNGARWQDAVALRWLALRDLIVPSLPQWHAQTLAAAAPEDEREVRVGLAGMLALVLAVVTLASVRYWEALVFAVPALFLGHWCLDAETPRPLAEARWLAKLALVITYTWLALYMFGNLLAALKVR